MKTFYAKAFSKVSFVRFFFPPFSNITPTYVREHRYKYLTGFLSTLKKLSLFVEGNTRRKECKESVSRSISLPARSFSSHRRESFSERRVALTPT